MDVELAVGNGMVKIEQCQVALIQPGSTGQPRILAEAEGSGTTPGFLAASSISFAASTMRGRQALALDKWIGHRGLAEG
jgi:hypothetical protein